MFDNRRRSEDWSSRSWRMGEGPRAAEILGEFGDGVKRKQSGQILGPRMGMGSLKGRPRGASFGWDSQAYAEEEEDDDDDGEWGVDVAGMRVGEVSALTGEGEFLHRRDVASKWLTSGVEALFTSVSSLLVQRREKIQQERTLRKKNSVLLVDASSDAKAKTQSRSCCV